MYQRWLELAKELPTNSKTRVQCCGQGKDAIVSHGRRYYSYHCFKCDTEEYETVGIRPLSDLSLFNDRAKENIELELPSDYTPDIPAEHRRWLYDASIDDVTSLNAGIGWSPRYHRIILPLYSPSGQLLYWQGRSVHKDQLPKYINPAVDKATLLYRAGDLQSTARIVVCEDILSAIRVGKHVPACSILGTTTSDDQAGVLSDYELVSYWLDPDAAGKRGSRKGKQKLSLVTNVEILTSKVDPKNLPDRVIRRILGLPDLETYTYHGRTLTQDTEA